MQKEQLIKQFHDNQSEITEIINTVAIWSDDPDKDVCKIIRDGLHALAQAGDKNAAALYCAITAYDNHANSFSAEIACNLVFANQALAEYHALIEKEFYSIVDAYHYEYLYAFPIIPMFRELANCNKETIETPEN